MSYLDVCSSTDQWQYALQDGASAAKDTHFLALNLCAEYVVMLSAIHWRELFHAAVLELDGNKLPQRITVATNAINKRIEQLRPSSETSETEALLNALNVLRDLDKMTPKSPPLL